MQGLVDGQVAALKLFHGRKEGAEEAYQHELEMYEALAILQGKTIPRLLCCGILLFTDTLFLALSLEGSGLDESYSGLEVPDEVEAGMVMALGELHQVGALHGDVRLANFTSSDDGRTVRLIDLGRSVLMPAKPDRAEIEGLDKAMESELCRVHAICKSVTLYDR
jgi:serine/threonine protein kinase